MRSAIIPVADVRSAPRRAIGAGVASALLRARGWQLVLLALVAARRRRCTGPRAAAVALARALIAAQRELHHHRHGSIRASRTLTGDEILTWRNTTAHAGHARCSFHLYYNAWRNTARPGCASGASPATRRRIAAAVGLGLDRRHQHPAASRADGSRPPISTATLRFIAPDDGNADDRTVIEVPLAAAVAPGETHRRRDRVDVARAAHVRAHRRHRQLLLHRAVVSEDRRARGHGLELPPVPRRDRVLLRLRHLRRPADGADAAGSSAPPGVERERRDDGDGTTTHRYYQEDVHDFAWTTSPDYVERTATLRASDAAAGRDAAAAAAGARGAGRAPLRRDARDAASTTASGSAPIRTATSRSSIRRGRAAPDGMEYPTLFTAGTRWLAPRSVDDARGGHGPRGRAPVLVRHRRQQRVRARVDGRRLQHVLDRARDRAGVRRRILLAQRYLRRLHAVGVPRPAAHPRDRRRTASPATAERARATCRRRRPGGTCRRPPGAITYNKTALWLNTLERMLGWATLQRVLSTYFARLAFKHPKPEDFFAVVNEVSGRDLTWFFDQVYRSSNVFDYGVDVFTSEPDRGHSTAAACSGTRRSYASRRRWRRHLPGRRPRHVREQRGGALALGRARSLEGVRDRRPVRARLAQVDPERVLLLDVQLHEQLGDAHRETAGRAARSGR